MNQIQTDYGTILILDLQSIFQKKIDIINHLASQSDHPISIGLTGGSTPKAFYQWAVQHTPFKQNTLDQILWMTSDERYLPLESPESNFGNADRLMLTPLSVPPNNKRPWDVSASPNEAATLYNNYFTKNNCFDLCFLGMGDDCHIASIFPESPLILNSPVENFTSLNIPNKGIRLTITPNGLNRCKQIVMIVTGHSKSASLKQVLQGPFNPQQKPAQLHRNWANKVTWLVDTSAASELQL